MRALVSCLVASALLVPPAVGQTSRDAVLRSRVEAALRASSDIPVDSITVQVQGAVATLTGSVICDACGGNATPPGAGTVQQSLGAVVRAVPGITDVRFVLRYRAPPPPP
jgi:osmotically-inducible protein OsmY